MNGTFSKCVLPEKAKTKAGLAGLTITSEVNKQLICVIMQEKQQFIIGCQLNKCHP